MTLPVTKAVREQFGEAFHTGLRKGVDSRYSALAWNATRATPRYTWSEFCDYMLHNTRTLSFKKFEERLRSFKPKIKPRNPEERTLINVFTLAMAEMPEDDVTSLWMWIQCGFEK